ncbi:hypothetical protein RHSIM_Rhsim11G0133400 [Rhododendron simsii]|uniref:Uncharacterized protein n=1 Tax=Rhododendron simsii TaxID=118357 RepID=A0A834G7H0_RHOSS|nr:hypothetical protein RHSIM_Rhsim11G0133400 [Rhododendron simsii]
MISDPTESPRKRLLADPKPKHGSSSSAPAAATPFDLPDRKKTRDLPNLSDCHSCGLHTDSTNPRVRLQTLPSFWRVVLLCRPCLNRVESANLCSYCFSSVADSDCHRCRDCDRRVHKDCVVRYNCSAPWSYCCGPELGPFRVCVDCWVPKSLKNSSRVCKRRRRRSKTQLGFENPRKSGGLEVVVNDAKRAVERKARVAVKAKEKALRTAVVASRAAKLANGFLDLVARKDGSECSVSVSSSGSETTAATTTTGVDAELAFRLHRAMNSSPRISRNLCVANSSCLPVPRLQKGIGNLSGSRGSRNASVGGKMEECRSRKLIEDTDASVGSRGSPDPCVSGKIEECPSHRLNETNDARVSQPEVKVVYARRSVSGRCTNSFNLKRSRLVYTRRCKKDKGCQEKGGVVVGNRDTCDDSSLIFEPQTCHKQDEAEFELHLDEARNPNQQNCEGNGAMLNVERSNGKTDRYLLKYSKRPHKELEYELHPDDTRNQNHVSCNGNGNMPLDECCNGKLDRYMIKYTKRRVVLKGILDDETNFHCDDSSVESEDRAVGVGLYLNWSGESGTLSDASFQSSTVSVEASACAHVLSEDPS